MMSFALPDYSQKVNTDRFGPYLFHIGCDASQLETLVLRVNDAQQRFSSSPFSQVAHLLEKEVAVSGLRHNTSLD